MCINGRTQLYGLLGYPVKHTFSPMMHNTAFKALGINAVYLPFEVKPEDLKAVLSYMKSIGVRGLNVTIPHKEKVLKYLDEIDREASLIGAVNTIVIKQDKLKGFNTDGSGFVISMKEGLNISPKGKSFFIVGAGGASRAISFSLALRGARRIVLVDNINKKAMALAKSIARKTSCETIALKADKKAVKELIFNSEVLINATPCGMKRSDRRIVNPDFLHNRLIVCDVIYSVPLTRLLQDAKERGLPFLNGIGMLLHQGALSFSIWTKRTAPLGAMKRAFTKALSK